MYQSQSVRSLDILDILSQKQIACVCRSVQSLPLYSLRIYFSRTGTVSCQVCCAFKCFSCPESQQTWSLPSSKMLKHIYEDILVQYIRFNWCQELFCAIITCTFHHFQGTIKWQRHFLLKWTNSSKAALYCLVCLCQSDNEKCTNYFLSRQFFVMSSWLTWIQT